MYASIRGGKSQDRGAAGAANAFLMSNTAILLQIDDFSASIAGKLKNAASIHFFFSRCLRLFFMFAHSPVLLGLLGQLLLSAERLLGRLQSKNRDDRF